MPTRSLTPGERDTVERLLDECAFDAKSLRAQADSAEVWNINEDGSIVRFENSPLAPSAPTPLMHFVLVEATAMDKDGVTIHVLLHVRKGRLYELEYFREDTNPMLRTPEANDLIGFVVSAQ